MTSKEALERLKDDIEINYLSTKHSNEKDKSNYLILLNSIEKDLEILEIIKKHKLLNYVLKSEKCTNMYHLSKEECDLLREIENE